jgi:hypothetical protein
VDATIIKQLVYSSVSSQPFSEEQLEQLLITSRENNQNDSITGMLLYRRDCFIQVLEGPEDKVATCYQRICSDPRHTGFIKLFDSNITHRAFENWAMAFNGNPKDKIEGLSDFLHPYRSADEPKIAEGAVKQLLKRFREVNRR